MAKTVNVMDYIDPLKWPAIENYLYIDDHTIEVQNALDDAAGGSLVGKGGEVKFPAGGFVGANWVTYRQQYIHGAYASTILKQIGSNDIFTTSAYVSDIVKSSPGRLIEKLSFITDNPTAGGNAIRMFGYKDQISNIVSTGLPITLCGQNHLGITFQTGNHNLFNIYIDHSPRGAILTQGPVTDTIFSYLFVNNCGTIGGPAAIDVGSTAGWEFHFAKVFSCPGKVFRTPSVWNLIITGSYFDYLGGDDCAFDLTSVLPKDEGARISGNQFRLVTETPGAYNLIKFKGGHIHLTHIGNIYNISTATSGVNACGVTLYGSSYDGNSIGNEYNLVQRGNAESLLGPLQVSPFDLRERIA